MATITLYLPDKLRLRMDNASGEDWSAIALEAFESHLERLEASHGREEQVAANAAYDHGYAWARDRAAPRDLRTLVDAPNYQSAANVARQTKGFSQSDEFGDCAYHSDEMWEAFVDGATALYNEQVDKS